MITKFIVREVAVGMLRTIGMFAVLWLVYRTGQIYVIARLLQW